MSNKVLICNIALNRIGVNPIVSFLDNTKEANQCSLIYDRVVEQVLSEHSWSTATYRSALAQLTSTPTYGFSYQYQLPSDPKVLRVLEINQTRPDDYEYSIEGNLLLTDLTSVDIKYIGLVSNSENYGPYITSCVESKLAAELAYILTGDRNLTQLMFQAYTQELKDKITLDSLQGSSETIVATTLEDVR